eukprot:TRINITY_DN393_c0_g1_i9.p5 TRINITY_DN393_c0_g1~~TRINITY_DN393_c0_g1_i9.p5  ORF type:complete len:59 (+),score=49.78 TRINITY_DN393_c0_g1_i9:319-495(+)
MNAKQWYQRRVHGASKELYKNKICPDLPYDKWLLQDLPKKKKYRLRGRSSETAKAHRG